MVKWSAIVIIIITLTGIVLTIFANLMLLELHTLRENLQERRLPNCWHTSTFIERCT